MRADAHRTVHALVLMGALVATALGGVHAATVAPPHGDAAALRAHATDPSADASTDASGHSGAPPSAIGAHGDGHLGLAGCGASNPVA